MRAREDFLITVSGRELRGELLEGFAKFWNNFAYNKGMAEAADVWLDVAGANPGCVDRIINAARRARDERTNSFKGYAAATWLARMRWMDYEPLPVGKAHEAAAAMQVAAGGRVELPKQFGQELNAAQRSYVLKHLTPEQEAIRRDRILILHAENAGKLRMKQPERGIELLREYGSYENYCRINKTGKHAECYELSV